jgi:hypothetical protein
LDDALLTRDQLARALSALRREGGGNMTERPKLGAAVFEIEMGAGGGCYIIPGEWGE